MSILSSAAERVFRRKRQRSRLLWIAACIGLAVATWLVVSAVSQRGTQIEISLHATPAPAETNSSYAQSAQVMAVAHVVGEVLHPGLYSVRAGARVIDVIMLAGGLTSTADQCAVNLARAIADGEQIVVPRAEHPGLSCATAQGAAGAVNSSARPKVSLSRASLAELDALPGVGPALAQRIIDWRQAHGGFTKTSDLDSVSGIGPSILAQILPMVTL